MVMVVAAKLKCYVTEYDRVSDAYHTIYTYHPGLSIMPSLHCVVVYLWLCLVQTSGYLKTELTLLRPKAVH